MSNVDYLDLMDAVAAEMGLPEDQSFAEGIAASPVPANDNMPSWPVIPFPSGWWASP